MRIICLWIAAVSLAMAGHANAELELVRGEDAIEVPARIDGLSVHNVFQSNMVIQRDKPIRVWGWATGGEDVAVSFAGHRQAARAEPAGTWAVELPAVPANATPQRMVIEGRDKTITLENILVGDVWLLGGQSNMEFEIAKVDGGELEMVSAHFPNIRLFTVPQQNGPNHKVSFPIMYQWSDWFKRHYRQGYWDVCTPESVRDMSAIGYIFARRIHMATQVPIGVVDASRGGTCIETWIPREELDKFNTPEVTNALAEWDRKVAEFDPQKDLEARIKKFNEQTEKLKAEGRDVTGRTPPTEAGPGPALDMNRPGNCYASMIAPLAGFAIKGAIWHQGFNNAMQPNGHAMYYQLFPSLIASWRAAFGDPHMPFGIISLCTAGDPQNPDDYLEKMADEGILIREVQYRTFLDYQKAGDQNVGYASSFDLRRSWYHPQIKIPAGERIAAWALATQYGKKVRWLPPQLKDVKTGDGRIILHLDSAAGPYNDGPILGFAIAGKDGKFQPAKADWLNKNPDPRAKPDYDRTAIVLTSPLVPEPVYFRHAWGRNPLANLKSADRTDLPFATQRNDTFTLADLYEIYTGRKSATPGVLDRSEFGQLRQALQAEDRARRIAEAQALLEGVQDTP